MELIQHPLKRVKLDLLNFRYSSVSVGTGPDRLPLLTRCVCWRTRGKHQSLSVRHRGSSCRPRRPSREEGLVHYRWLLNQTYVRHSSVEHPSWTPALGNARNPEDNETVLEPPIASVCRSARGSLCRRCTLGINTDLYSKDTVYMMSNMTCRVILRTSVDKH